MIPPTDAVVAQIDVIRIFETATPINVWITIFGALILVLSLFVGLLKGKDYLPTQPLIAFVGGILLGPQVLGWVHLSTWGDPMTVLEQAARLTIAFSVMTAALRIPRTYFGDQTEAMATLLGPGQIFMAGVSGLLAYWLFGLPFWVGMILGAILTPTDPVLASTIVTGETAKNNIPGRIRHMLSGESGANDGGAYPLVFLCAFMIQYEFGRALSRWAVQTLLWDVAFAVALGIGIGAAAGKIQEWALDNDILNETPLTTITVSLALVVLGATHVLGSDGILAVFVAGLAFNRVAPGDPETEQEEATDTVERLFTIPVFFMFGTYLPWSEWFAMGWTGVALVAGVLVLRRLPMVFALERFLPPIQRNADAALAGWFGPIGVAAIYYATLSHHMVGGAGRPIWPIASLVIAGSIVATGVTTTVGTHYYGRETGFFREQQERRQRQQSGQESGSPQGS